MTYTLRHLRLPFTPPGLPINRCQALPRGAGRPSARHRAARCVRFGSLQACELLLKMATRALEASNACEKRWLIWGKLVALGE